MKNRFLYVELARKLKLLPKYFKNQEKICGIFFHLNFDYIAAPFLLFILLPFFIYSLFLFIWLIDAFYFIPLYFITILVHLGLIPLIIPRISHRWLGFDVIIFSDLKIYEFLLLHNKHSIDCVRYADARVKFKDPKKLNNLQVKNIKHVNLFKQKGRIEVFNFSKNIIQNIWVYHYYSVACRMIANFMPHSTVKEYFKDQCSSQELQDIFVQLHPCHINLIHTLEKRQQDLEKEYQEYKKQYESFVHKAPLIPTNKLDSVSLPVPLLQPLTIYQRFFLPDEHLLYHYVPPEWENAELLFTDKQILVYKRNKLFFVSYPNLRLAVGKKIVGKPPKYKYLGLAWNSTPTNPKWGSIKINDIPQDSPILCIVGNFDVPIYEHNELIIGSEPLLYSLVSNIIPTIDLE